MVKSSEIFIRYSPNHGERPYEPTSLLVMHYTGMPSADAALEHLCNASSEVSAHYLIDEEGVIYLLVEEDRRAWHAGVGHWGGQENINDISIGIELVNPGHEYDYRPFPEAQIASLIALSQDIMERHEMRPADVVGHSDIAPMRKQDPGEWFPWARLAEHGIGLWHGIEEEDAGEELEMDQQIIEALQRFGYAVSDDPVQQQAVIVAFQRRFFPSHITGIWNEGCTKRLERLLTLSS